MIGAGDGGGVLLGEAKTAWGSGGAIGDVVARWVVVAGRGGDGVDGKRGKLRNVEAGRAKTEGGRARPPLLCELGEAPPPKLSHQIRLSLPEKNENQPANKIRRLGG